jgi:hypothetical protein
MEFPGPSSPAALPAALQAPAEHFARRIAELLGDAVRGLAIYGAAVAGPFHPEHDAVRSVLVLARADLELIRKLAQAGSGERRGRFAPPLVLTPRAIDSSRDTFPLELLEIQQWHVNLLGDEFFSALEFAAHDMRLQCEREIKVLEIAMHQGLLASRGHEEHLSLLSADLSDSLLRVLRGLVWLAGERQPQPRFHVIERVEKLIARPLPGVCAALDRSDLAGWHKFQRLYDDLQALGRFADGS